MSIRNYKTKCYVPPIGEDLQHDFCDDGVSIHSDVTLLNRLSDMRLSQSLMDGILSRFGQIKDDMPQEIFSKIIFLVVGSPPSTTVANSIFLTNPF